MSKKQLSAIARRMRPFALPFALFSAGLLVGGQQTADQEAGDQQEVNQPVADDASDVIMPEVDSDGDLIPDHSDPLPLVANVPVYWSVQKFALSRPAAGEPADSAWASASTLDIASVLPAPNAPSALTVMPLTSRKATGQLRGHPFAHLAVFGSDAIRLGDLQRARAAAFLRGWRAEGADKPISLFFTVRFVNFDAKSWVFYGLEVPLILDGRTWAMARPLQKGLATTGKGAILPVSDKAVDMDFLAELEASEAGVFLSRLVKSGLSPSFDFARARGLDNSTPPPADGAPSIPAATGAYSLTAAFQSIILKTRPITIEGPDGHVWTWRVAPVDLGSGEAVTFGRWSDTMNDVSKGVYGAPLFVFDDTSPISIAGWDNGFRDLHWSISRKGREINPSNLVSSRCNADFTLALSAAPFAELPPPGANKEKTLECLTLAAWQGSLPAMSALGDLLLKSGSLEGRDWIELAATAGDAKAAARLARFLRDGELGTEADPEAAAKWLQKAADAGDAPSLVSLGEALRKGEGVRRNPKKATECFRRAAESADGDGMTWYALSLMEGNGVRRNVPKALDLLARAADAGNAQAKFIHGVCLFSGYGGTEPDKPAAMVRFKAAAAEQPAANVFLGVGYLNGLGLSKNEKKAVECFKAAADRDLPAGILWLAHCHANGIGVEKDIEEARKWARKAADLGVPAGRKMLLSIQE